MNTKKLLFGSLLLASGLALFRKLFTSRATGKPAPNPTSYDAIDTYITEQMLRLRIPGAALAIVEGDQAVYFRGFGKARPGGEVPTSQTPFFIGSITKSITATAIMQLVEAGKVELDAPVQHYLPWFRVADPVASAQMTVRHLLNQTSGLPEMAGEIGLSDFDDRPDAVERQVRALYKIKLKHQVGSVCEYSNLNFNILGLIIEAASGESYPDYIQNHIFSPLKMAHSYTSQLVARQNSLAVGHRYWFSYPFPVHNLPVPYGSLPSGQLISCAEDLAHYLFVHLNGGRYGDTRILSSTSIDEMHRAAVEYTKWGFSGWQYGMGWFITDQDNFKIVSHGGNCPDFSAFMALVPEQKKGVILLLNADHYGIPVILEEVGMGITALLIGHKPAPIQLGFFPWIMRFLPMIPLLQLLGVFTILRKLNHWRQDSKTVPTEGRLWEFQILPSLIPNLSLTGILLYLYKSGLIGYLKLFIPDLAWIVRISGGFAAMWSFLRTRLVLQTWRKSRR
jgi:CubicO group peptidase (beta-lactamase class C family)